MNKRFFLVVLIISVFLIGTVSAIDTEPPASITNLINDTSTCDQVTFDWDNPPDQDFNGTEYWWNGVKGTNFTAADGSWILFGGLVGGMEYTFSTRTFDILGNANATFVNMTVFVTDCTGNPDFTANITCQIGAPLSVLFTGYCPDPTYKNHWDFGDGNTTDDVQSPAYIYNFTGAFTVTHSCTTAGEGSVSVNKTDYIVVGVNGTICPGSCPSIGYGGSSDDDDDWDLMWLVYGMVGGIVGIMFLSKR